VFASSRYEELGGKRYSVAVILFNISAQCIRATAPGIEVIVLFQVSGAVSFGSLGHGCREKTVVAFFIEQKIILGIGIEELLPTGVDLLHLFLSNGVIFQHTETGFPQ